MGQARRLGACLMLALVFAPSALAGTETDPEIDDHPDRGDPELDLLAAWLEPDPAGVKFTVKIAGAEDVPRDRLYFLSFTLDGNRYLAAIGHDHEGVLRGTVGTTDLGRNGGGIETFANNLADRGFTAGTPARFTAVIPWDSIAGLEPGAELEDLGAGTSVYRRGDRTWQGGVDTRKTDRSFVAKKPFLSTDAKEGLLALAPWLVGAPLLVGAGFAGALWWTRKRAGAPATRNLRPQGPEAPSREASPEEGKPRLRLRPPP